MSTESIHNACPNFLLEIAAQLSKNIRTGRLDARHIPIFDSTSGSKTSKAGARNGIYNANMPSIMVSVAVLLVALVFDHPQV